MKKKQADKAQNQKPPKRYKFFLGSRERYITIACDFESGNIQFIRQISEFQYRLASVFDGTNTDHRVNSKSWFYFSVCGFPRKTKGRFFVSKVQTLSSIFYSKYKNSYRPVYKVGQEGQWLRLPTQAQLVMRENNELECVFQYTFKDESEKVFFAFCYPYTYSESLRYLHSLNQYLYHEDFYYYKQVLIKSPENRDIHLITITSYDHPDKVNEHEQVFDENMFPERVRPLRFKKPVIFVSARVHPGETPASYTMKGVLDFLTSTTDLRANLLRKMFVFMIVPMINVDGVYHGHFRMDIQGKNLNRYYINPKLEKQPAVYGIKKLAEHLNKQNRLSFYFDLHAHNAKKGCFIYGNAINDFVEQVQSQVFCKLISMNNRGFEYGYCNFSQKHMKAKDRGEDLTKEGCGRVVMHKLAKIIHSYSVQCGIVSPNNMNDLPTPPNADFKLSEKGLTDDRCEDNNSSIYKTKGNENALFTIEMYENLGKNLMVSILDVFDKNPYNRVYNSKHKSMDMLRRITAFQIFHEAQRFRMFERFIFGKVKNINELIREVLNTKLHYKKLYNFYFFDDKQLKGVEWPDNIPGLAKPKIQSPTKMKKFRSVDSSSDYSLSFIKALLFSKTEEKKQVAQEDLEKQEGDDSQKSSETEDFEENKEMEESESIEKKKKKNIIQRQSSFYGDKSEQIRESSFSPTNKQISKSQLHIPRNPAELSLKLYVDVDDAQFHNNNNHDKKKQSPSVRVRRLMRQEFISGTAKSQKQSQRKSQKEIDIPTSTAFQFKKNIYESIKDEIREELKREQLKEKNKKKKSKFENNNNHQHQQQQQNKICSPVKIYKERIKSWTVKRADSGNATSKNKLHLPSLGTDMCIISTSAKAFLKKN